MVTLDTNILIYSVDNSAGDRHLSAAGLVERAVRLGRRFLTLQSLCEFFTVATRKLSVEPQAAATFIEDWQDTLIVMPAALGDQSDAIRAVRDYRLPFWDAMLWPTARRAGARFIISEDFQDGRVIEGVRVINPFAAHNAAAIEAALGG